MLRACNPREAGRSQRRDGHGVRVVGVVLVRPSRAQHPHPCRQRRRHVQDPLAGVEELLGQQVAEPAGGLDRPGAVLEARRPLQQLIDLASRRPHLHLAELRLVLVDRHRRVRPLVGIHADHHPHCVLLGRVR